jgi:hypothetical protein
LVLDEPVLGRAMQHQSCAASGELLLWRWGQPVVQYC